MKPPDFPPPGPFTTLHERWLAAYPEPRDVALEQELAASCRDAWSRNAPSDRLAVLYFVYHSKDPQFADLILEGLRSDDASLAAHAAALASVTQGRLWDLGPALRPAWRALTRRFPENDGFRPSEFQGHEPGDMDDWERHPFLNTYEDWRQSSKLSQHPDPDLTERLLAKYEDAWADGDDIERAFVLHFVAHRTVRDRVGADRVFAMIRQALASGQPGVAPTAAVLADFLVSTDEMQLASSDREALEQHVVRFPHQWVIVDGLLRRLRGSPA